MTDLEKLLAALRKRQEEYDAAAKEHRQSVQKLAETHAAVVQASTAVRRAGGVE